MPDPIPAETAPAVHVHAPSRFLHRTVRPCPTCRRRRRFVGCEAPWYGTTWTCCACGDSWTDGERHERPFRRGWRAVETSRARRLWVEAAAFKTIDHLAWIKERVGF